MVKDKFIFNEKVKEEKPDIKDSEINNRYLKGEIRIVTEQARYPLNTISNMLESGKYDLNPEYQRRKRWSGIQKSRLIESFIINVPIPPIFLYEVDYANYEVMDGLQRLTTIDDFYNNKFSLEGLEEWKELNGKTYEELPSRVKEGIDRRYLSSIVLLNETAKSKDRADYLKQLVFGRLNSGGDKLEPQETRNALYGGKLNDLCLKLSLNNKFRSLWSLPLIKIQNEKIQNEKELLESEQYRKMQDVELVLRFFAFRELEHLSKFSSQEMFLDEYLRQGNKFSVEKLAEMEKVFNDTIETISEIFGKKAFLMPPGSIKRTKPTKTVYDPLMYAIANKLSDKDKLIAKHKEINDGIYKDKSKLKLKKDKNNDLFDGKYNSRNNIQQRIDFYTDFFNQIIK